MDVIVRIKNFIRNSEISTKITLTYTACFFVLLFVINAAVWLGASYVVFSQGEKSLNESVENVCELLKKLEQDSENFDPNSIREPLLPGVVLRVADSDGEIFIDTDPRYPSIEKFNKGKVEGSPIFSNDEMELSEVKDTMIYCKKMNYSHDGEEVTMYFFRTIISDKPLFDKLGRGLIFIDVVSLIFGVVIGYLVSRKVLSPIKTVTELARSIAFGKMDGRIPIPPVNDELTALSKTLNDMLDRLQGGISKQQKFVSDASHELRTPATVIAGYTELLEKYGATDKEILDESIEAIRSEARNMQSLLENLLFLARADQRRQKLHKEIFELSEIVGDVMQKMKTVVKTHEVNLLQNDTGKVFGDKTTIRQMMRIFLDNAAKYTPAGGKITVESIREGNEIFLNIADSGIGISPENQPKVFERFFRIDTETLVDEANGSGLGLSIAKWIADNHDIKIDLKSELGKGTTFILKIPVHE